MLMEKSTFRILAYEVPGGSQSQRAAACLGMAKGVIASVISQIGFEDIPQGMWSQVGIMPSEVHKRVTGKLKATKDEVIDYVLKKYPNQIRFVNRKYVVFEKPEYKSTMPKMATYTKGEFEHIADAIVIGELAFESEE